jgi:hypothetical protein
MMCFFLVRVSFHLTLGIFSEIGQDTLPRVALQVMAASMCSTYAASSECFTRGVWWFLSVVSDIEMLAMIGNDDKKC